MIYYGLYFIILKLKIEKIFIKNKTGKIIMIEIIHKILELKSSAFFFMILTGLKPSAKKNFSDHVPGDNFPSIFLK